MGKPTYEELDEQLATAQAHLATAMHYLKQIATNAESGKTAPTAHQLKFTLENIERVAKVTIDSLTEPDKRSEFWNTGTL